MAPWRLGLAPCAPPVLSQFYRTFPPSASLIDLACKTLERETKAPGLSLIPFFILTRIFPSLPPVFPLYGPLGLCYNEMGAQAPAVFSL